jgi:hypothetical protein
MDDQNITEVDGIEDIIFEIRDQREGAPFSVDSDDAAAWTARKIAQAEARIGERKAQAEQYKERIDTWFAIASRRDIASIEFLKTLLKRYVIDAVAGLARGRTLHLPGVDIALRKRPDTVEILNEEAAIVYCTTYLPVAVEVKRSLIKSKLKQLITGGKTIPGTNLVQGTDELYIATDDKNDKAASHAA